MNGTTPVISVLMGVLNCEETLSDCLESLMAQTEDRWECIICDDGSTDRSAEIVREWQARYPGRFVLLQNEKNCGLSRALNRCLAAARGEYTARLDGDDRCAPERFAVERKYLEDHPETAIVSTDMECFDQDGVWGLKAYPTDPQPADLVHGTPFCHPACMVRREAIDQVHGYSESEKFLRVEDYDLWVRMYEAGFRGHNIHEPLYFYRDDRNAASRRKWTYRVNEARTAAQAVKRLKLPLWNCIFVLRPLIMGLLPGGFASFLHHQKLKRGTE